MMVIVRCSMRITTMKERMGNKSLYSWTKGATQEPNHRDNAALSGVVATVPSSRHFCCRGIVSASL